MQQPCTGIEDFRGNKADLGIDMSKIDLREPVDSSLGVANKTLLS